MARRPRRERVRPCDAVDRERVRARPRDRRRLRALVLSRSPRRAGSLLAIELDGEALSIERGGPVRLVPVDEERECWEHIKWVSRIEISDEPSAGDDTARDLALSRLE